MGIGMIFWVRASVRGPRNFRGARPKSREKPGLDEKTPTGQRDVNCSRRASRARTRASRATLRYGFGESADHADHDERRDVSASSRRIRPRRLRRRVVRRMLRSTERTRLALDRACSSECGEMRRCRRPILAGSLDAALHHSRRRIRNDTWGTPITPAIGADVRELTRTTTRCTSRRSRRATALARCGSRCSFVSVTT